MPISKNDEDAGKTLADDPDRHEVSTTSVEPSPISEKLQDSGRGGLGSSSWNAGSGDFRSYTGWMNNPEPNALDDDALDDALDDDSSLLPHLKIPGLKLKAIIGRGGSAIVYKAKQLRLNRYVAVKILPPAFSCDSAKLTRIYREASAAGGLFEDSILPVYDLIECQGVPMIVMPLIQGGTFEKVVEDRRRFLAGEDVPNGHPWSRLDTQGYLDHVLPRLDDLVASVYSFHEKGILHRDIKPSNLLLSRMGRLWLSDFGLARMHDEMSITKEGEAMGTRGYMSPEQQTGRLDIDQRADLFSLTATIYRILTLGYPYQALYIGMDSPTPLAPSKRQPLLSKDYDYVLLKTLELDKNDRFANTAEFAKAWREAREGRGQRISRLDRVARLVKRNRRTLVIGAITSVLMTLAALTFLWSARALPVDLPSGIEVEIDSDPSGGSFAFVQLNAATHEPEWDPKLQAFDLKRLFKVTAKPGRAARLRLPPGNYLVEVGIPGVGHHRVWRNVPDPSQYTIGPFLADRWTRSANGTVRLASIKIPKSSPQGVRSMTRIEGDGEFLPYWDRGMLEERKPRKGMETFYLDVTEVTGDDFLSVMKLRPKDGVPLGPRKVPGGPSPVNFVSWDEAREYAELAGTRLPTDGELRYVYRTGYGSDLPFRVNLLAFWTTRLMGAEKDCSTHLPPILNLRSGHGEWTQTAVAWRNFGMSGDQTQSNSRVTHGADLRDVLKGLILPWPRRAGYEAGTLRTYEQHPGLSFRCAVSVEPMFLEGPPGTWTPSARTVVSGNRKE